MELGFLDFPFTIYVVRLAITADWLVTKGGAERVLVEMLLLWPQAPIFTTVEKVGCLSPLHPQVRTTVLQHWYRLFGSHRMLLPWMPRAVESWDLRGFDVILSSSHAVAKGCIPSDSARHICYCHTPMRYAWEMEEEYLNDFKLSWPLRAIAKRELRKIRDWDCTTAKRVDLFIANSHEVQERIRKIYGRESIVLHPPVDDRFFENPLSSSVCLRQTTRSLSTQERTAQEASRRLRKAQSLEESDYCLAVGRLVPYKRFDLIIEVANKEKIPLKIVGEGHEGRRLRKLAGETVELLGRVPEKELPALYANAKATIFPVHEDAGIVPLESQACGTPVIAYGRGGVLDTVQEGKTGIFFKEQTVESLTEALKKFETMQFDPVKIREHAAQFSSAKFREKLREIVCFSTEHSFRSSPTSISSRLSSQTVRL